MNLFVAMATLCATIAVVLFCNTAFARYEILHLPTTTDGTKLRSSDIIITPFLYTGYDSTVMKANVALAGTFTNQSAVTPLMNTSIGSTHVSILETNTLNTCSELSDWANTVMAAAGVSNPSKSYTAACNTVRAMYITGAIFIIVGWLILLYPIVWTPPVLGQHLAMAAGCMWLGFALLAIHAVAIMALLDDIAVQVTTEFDGSNDVQQARMDFGNTLFFVLISAIFTSVLACNSYISGNPAGGSYAVTANPTYVSYVA